MLRKIPAEHAGMRAGGWQTTIGGDLQGATLGLVGFATNDSGPVLVALVFSYVGPFMTLRALEVGAAVP